MSETEVKTVESNPMAMESSSNEEITLTAEGLPWQILWGFK